MRHQTKRSKTWMIFEKHMMGRKPDQGNFEFPDMNRGAAINLCQGLNAAQAFWQKELTLPDSEIFFSAKAKRRGESDIWYVEISEAHTKQGTRNRGNAAWMQSLLDLPASIPQNAYALKPKEVEGTFFTPDDPRAANPDEEWMESVIFGKAGK